MGVGGGGGAKRKVLETDPLRSKLDDSVGH